MLSHVDKPFGPEHAGVHQRALVQIGAHDVRVHFGMEKVDPFAVVRVCHHAGAAAVAAEYGTIRRYIIMHRPFVALQMVLRARAV